MKKGKCPICCVANRNKPINMETINFILHFFKQCNKIWTACQCWGRQLQIQSHFFPPQKSILTKKYVNKNIFKEINE
jgi:hypothetical protein